MPWTQSLRAKLLVPTIGMAIVGAVFVAWLANRNLAKRLYEESHAKAVTLAELLTASASTEASPARLGHLVKSFGGQRYVKTVALIEGNPPRVVASSNSARVGKLFEHADALQGSEPIWLLSEDGNQLDYIEISPLVVDDFGSKDFKAAHISLDLRYIGSMLRTEAIVYFLEMLGIILASLLLALRLINVHVVRPIGALSQAMALQADGDTSARADASSKDEIGALAEHFNRMIDIQAHDERRMLSLVRSLPGVVFRKDAETGNVVIAGLGGNLQGQAILDEVRQVLEGSTSPSDLIARDSESRVYEIEHRVELEGGESRWWLERGTAVEDSDGIVRWVDGVMLDISKRKRMESALAASEERLRKFHECAPVGIALIDSHGVIRDMNRRCTDTLGGASVGSWFPQYLEDDCRAKFLREIDVLEATDSFGPRTTTIRSDCGGTHQCRVTGFATNDAGEQVVWLMLEDITEAERLAEVNRALLDAIPDIVMWISPEARIRDFRATRDAELYAGGSFEAEPHVSEVLPSAVAHGLLGAIGRANSSGETQSFEYQLTDRTGSQRYYEGRVAIMAANGYLALIRDITDRKDTEKRLQQVNQALLASLESQQRLTKDLESALQDTKAAALAKQQFLHTMSHELRTPLNGVLGGAEILSRSELDFEQRTTLETITGSASALKSIAEAALDYTDGSVGDARPAMEEFDIEDIVDEVLVDAAALLAGKNVECAALVDQKFPQRVCGEVGSLKKLLGHLMSSVARSANDGDILLRVECESSETNQMMMVARIEHQQTGHPVRLVGHAGSMSLEHALCERLAVALGGELRAAESAHSVVKIPLRVKESAESAHPDGTPLAGHRALLLEDRPITRSVLWNALVDAGCIVVEPNPDVGSASAAALVDLVDVVVGSHSAIREIARSKPDAAVPLVYIEPASQVWSEIGFEAAHVMKISRPVRRREALRVVASAVERTESARSPHVPGFRVLVADDNPTNRRVLGKMLERLGMRPVFAETGIEAVELVESQAFDAILMDCQMPGMDGFEATRRIRLHESSRGRRTPIIAVTANVLQGDRERCLASGMDECLAKPVRLETLKLTLAHWVTPQAA